MNEAVEKLLKKEPSFLDFTYKGYACRIIRSLSLMSLLGYVAIEKNHVFYNVGYDDINIDVHGGLTYASNKQPPTVVKDTMTNKLDYITMPHHNKPKNAWWVGFDCSHYGDIIPAHPLLSNGQDTYKGIEFVKNEIKGMVNQLISINNNL